MNRRPPLFLRVSVGVSLATAAVTSLIRADGGQLAAPSALAPRSSNPIVVRPEPSAPPMDDHVIGGGGTVGAPAVFVPTTETDTPVFASMTSLTGRFVSDAPVGHRGGGRSGSAGHEPAGRGSTGGGSTGGSREGGGRESAGRESAGREGGGRESAGRESDGRESAGREGGGRESAGRESDGREGAGESQSSSSRSASDVERKKSVSAASGSRAVHGSARADRVTRAEGEARRASGGEGRVVRGTGTGEGHAVAGQEGRAVRDAAGEERRGVQGAGWGGERGRHADDRFAGYDHGLRVGGPGRHAVRSGRA